MRKRNSTSILGDERGLIREAYQMPGLSDADCRSIFFDWALGLPDDVDIKQNAEMLLALYANEFPDHPMTRLLTDAQGKSKTNGRRRRKVARRGS